LAIHSPVEFLPFLLISWHSSTLFEAGVHEVRTNFQTKEGDRHMETKVRDGVAEDRITGAIESQTSRIPSSGYLAAAFGAIAVSAILKIARKDDWALFVGQWPAAFMLMGVYNKMVKQHGSDGYNRAS
jgi:hypothetical protein